MDINALFKISYGIYIVSAKDNDRFTGCIVNSIMQITAEPPTVAISVHRDNYTNKVIQESGRFSISVLTEQTPPRLIGEFGYKSGKDYDKFENAEYDLMDNLPILRNACAGIVCKVIDKMETYTHTVFLGQVENAEILGDGQPMTYSYYHNVIKGKSPKNAPTYNPADFKKTNNQNN